MVWGYGLLFNSSFIEASTLEVILIVIGIILALFIIYYLLLILFKILKFIIKYILPIFIVGFSTYMILFKLSVLDYIVPLDLIIKNSEIQEQIYSVDIIWWVSLLVFGVFLCIVMYRPRRKKLYIEEDREEDIYIQEDESSTYEESTSITTDLEGEGTETSIKEYVEEEVGENEDSIEIEPVEEEPLVNADNKEVQESEDSEKFNADYGENLKSARNYFEEALVRIKYRDYKPAILMFKSEVEKELKKRLLIQPYEESNFAEIINQAYYKGIIDNNMKERLHWLRKIRNKIEHDENGVHINDSVIEEVKKLIYDLAEEFRYEIKEDLY